MVPATVHCLVAACFGINSLLDFVASFVAGAATQMVMCLVDLETEEGK